MLSLKRLFTGRAAADPDPESGAPDDAEACRAAALGHVQAGRFDQARSVVNAGLALDPDAVPLHLLSANLLLQANEPDAAVRSFRRALDLRPDLPEAHYNCGLAFERLDRMDDALHAYGEAIRQRADYVAAIQAQTALMRRQDRLHDAVEGQVRLTQLNPDSSEPHFALATLLLELDRPEEALAALDRCIALDPALAAAHSNRATALSALKRLHEALASAEIALQIQPRFTNAALNKATLLLALGRTADALVTCQQALIRDPRHPGMLNCHGIVQQELRHPEAALAAYDLALQADPGHAPARINRSLTLASLDRYDEALADLDAVAVAVDPATEPEVWANRGWILQEMARHEEALPRFARAIALRPDFPEAHFNDGVSRLALGIFGAGWRGYEWRWQSNVWLNGQGEHVSRSFTRPRWSGAESLEGKTILLHYEQGLGDTLQFCRYATHLSLKGARVILEVQTPLKALLASIEGASTVIGENEPVPEHDFHCPLMSLPMACHSTVDSIPGGAAYVGLGAKHRDRAAAWRERIGHSAQARVGLVWSGNAKHRNDRNRSIPFASFASVLSDRHAFFSLQTEYRNADRAVLEDVRVRRFQAELRDFADTAALIENLDLVVCVDSSVAHLAGAMGKPTWLLVPANADFRWLVNRDDSPWYPSMRLFRQERTGEWAPTLERVRAALDGFAP